MNPALASTSEGKTAGRHYRQQKSFTAARTRLTLVIPLVNEAASLQELYERISSAVLRAGLSAEFIFVDDGSTDNSFEVLSSLSQRDRRIRVIQFRRNYGKSAALAAGFSRANGNYIITMDADLQDDPDEIQNLIRELEKGYDLVSGWKKQRHDPFVKRVTSKIFNAVSGMMTGVRLHDMNCGLKIYRREVTQSVPVYGELHRFLPVLAHREGFKIGEVEVVHHPRKHGKSKFGPSRFTRGFFDLLTVLFLTRYTRRPLHLFGLAGAAAFAGGFAISAYLAFERLRGVLYLTNRPILLLGLVLMIIGFQMVSIGLLGEMIAAGNRDTAPYKIKREIIPSSNQ